LLKNVDIPIKQPVEEELYPEHQHSSKNLALYHPHQQ
jgi:hypothetical protein